MKEIAGNGHDKGTTKKDIFPKIPVTLKPSVVEVIKKDISQKRRK